MKYYRVSEEILGMLYASHALAGVYAEVSASEPQRTVGDATPPTRHLEKHIEDAFPKFLKNCVQEIG